jgi:putative flippase GtrA
MDEVEPTLRGAEAASPPIAPKGRRSRVTSPAASVWATLSSASWWSFVLIGLAGVGVNAAVSILLQAWLRTPPLISLGLGIELGTLWTFFGNDRWTFRAHGRARPQFVRLVRFHLQTALGAGLNLGVFAVLTNVFDLAYALADLPGVLVGALVGWLLATQWTWSDV